MTDDADPLGPLEQALRSYGERSSRLRAAIGVPFVFLGLLAGVETYGQVHASFEGGGVKFVGEAISLAAGVPAALVAIAIVALGIFTAKKAVRLQSNRWIDQLAKLNQVDVASLRAATEIFD